MAPKRKRRVAVRKGKQNIKRGEEITAEVRPPGALLGDNIPKNVMGGKAQAEPGEPVTDIRIYPA